MSDADVEVVRLLGERFIARRDVKAVQGEPHVEKGGKPLAWQPVRSPFTMADFTAHLDGSRTFGHYMVNPEDSHCKLFAFDLDLRENKEERRNARGEVIDPAFEGVYGDETGFHPCNPREDWGKVDHPARPYLTRNLSVAASCLAQTIHEELEIPVAVALSGHKGLHVYGFTGSVPAIFAREAALRVLKEMEFTPYKGDNFWTHIGFSNLMVEVFPKQDSMEGKDFGNLMKLPLGVHKATGKRGHFVRVPQDEIVVTDPIEALSGSYPW